MKESWRQTLTQGGKFLTEVSYAGETCRPWWWHPSWCWTTQFGNPRHGLKKLGIAEGLATQYLREMTFFVLETFYDIEPNKVRDSPIFSHRRIQLSCCLSTVYLICCRHLKSEVHCLQKFLLYLSLCLLRDYDLKAVRLQPWDPPHTTMSPHHCSTPG